MPRTNTDKSVTAKKTGTQKKSSLPVIEPKSKAVQNKQAMQRSKNPLIFEIACILLIAFSILLIIGVFLGGGGTLGNILGQFLKSLFGVGAYILPFMLIYFCMQMFFSEGKKINVPKCIMSLLLFLLVIAFFHILNKDEQSYKSALDYTKSIYINGSYNNGGFFGALVGDAFYVLLGKFCSVLVIVLSSISLAVLITGKSFFTTLRILWEKCSEYLSYDIEVQDNDYVDYEDDDFDESGETVKHKNRNIFSMFRKNSSKDNFEDAEEDIIIKDGVKYKRMDSPTIINISKEEYNADVPDAEKKLDIAFYKAVNKQQKMVQKSSKVRGSYPDVPEFLRPERPYDLYESQVENEYLGEPGLNFINTVDEKLFEGINYEEFKEYEGEYDEIIISHEIEENSVESEINIEYLEQDDNGIDLTIQEEKLSNQESTINIKSAPEKIITKEVSKEPEENILKEPENTEMPKIIKAEEEKIVTKLNIDSEAEGKQEYVFPELEFLNKNSNVKVKNNDLELVENSKILIRTLASFNVEAKVLEISKGPSVTRYEIAIKDGIKVSKILGLADNLALSLAATSIRVEAPIPGKAAVGIEIPNKEVTSVYLSEVICNEKFQKFPSKLSFGLGKDIAGNVMVTDIAKMPHMLIAGSTGSGKSVCINTLITSILYKATPSEVKLIMIDPKVVELSVYNGIPHLLVPVVTEPEKAASALNWAVSEMMGRYDLFAQAGTRNLQGYNEIMRESGQEKIPQIVIIIDELADLMMVAAKEVEASICRLAQLARAAGIHLIIATQRPSVDVITGLIKANIPSRIAFAVSSGTDSRTVIDTVGAEKLLGKGDMLFKPVDLNKPVRIQGAFVTEKEIENIVEFLKENNESNYDEAVLNKINTSSLGDNGGSSSGGTDELTDEVIEFLVRAGKASTSMVQRKFKIGYNRAARIVEELEDRGIVGAENGSKPREVLMDKYQMEEYFTRKADY